jgi:hypothetical protein
MIQTRIYLPQSSYLFKTLKKKNLLENEKGSPLFIWLNYKPCIGELIEINPSSIKEEKLTEFLFNRNKSIVLRIIDLKQKWMSIQSDPNGITSISLKVYEEDDNWLIDK